MRVAAVVGNIIAGLVPPDTGKTVAGLNGDDCHAVGVGVGNDCVDRKFIRPDVEDGSRLTEKSPRKDDIDPGGKVVACLEIRVLGRYGLPDFP